jgi:hypothetical protein
MFPYERGMPWSTRIKLSTPDFSCVHPRGVHATEIRCMRRQCVLG